MRIVDKSSLKTKVAGAGVLSLVLVLSLPSVGSAALADAADDFDAAAVTLNDFSIRLNDNFDAVINEINTNLGGSVIAPHVFSGLGDDVASAADDLRISLLSAAADDFDAAAVTLNDFSIRLNDNFDAVINEINTNLGGSVIAPHVFSGLGDDVASAADDLRISLLSAAADDFDAAAVTLNDFSIRLNDNFDAVINEINTNLGGSVSAPHVFSGLGDDFTNAAADLRIAAIPEASSVLVWSVLAVCTCLRPGIRRRAIRGKDGIPVISSRI